MRPDDLIDFTPELRRQALDLIERYDWGPLYTPPTERGTIVMPGIAGGASWSGAAVDPITGWLYVTSRTIPFVSKAAGASSDSGRRITENSTVPSFSASL